MFSPLRHPCSPSNSHVSNNHIGNSHIIVYSVLVVEFHPLELGFSSFRRGSLTASSLATGLVEWRN